MKWLEGAQIQPPPFAKASMRLRVSSIASGRLPVMPPWMSSPPWNTSSEPNSLFSSTESMPAARGCREFSTSTPASIRSGIRSRTEPQVCSQIFACGAAFFTAENTRV